MITEFDDERMEIRFLLDEAENYKEGLKKVNILEKQLNNKNGSIDKDDFWFIHYDKAFIYFKTERYNEMREHINKAKLYYDSKAQKNLINWLTVEYNRDNNINKEESLILIDEMENYYEESNKPIFASSMRVNKALILHNVVTVKKEIEFVMNLSCMNTKIADEYRSDLFNIYIENINENRLEIAKLIKSVHNKNLQKELKEQILQQLKVA